MKRDTLKTLAGLVIIGVIVVATFLYGNAQRQAQIKHDQDVKKQQEAQAAKSTMPSTAAQPSSSASTVPTTAQANTAPVKSPTSNSLQGTGSTQTPKPSGQVAAAATTPTPAASPTSSPLPTTGSPIDGIFGVMALVASVVALRWSKKSLLAAARTPR